MMDLWLIGFPLAMAAAALACQSNRWRPLLLLLGAVGHLILVGRVLLNSPAAEPVRIHAWLWLDPLGKVVLALLSVLFLLGALYAPGYLAVRHDKSNRLLCANLLAALAMMTLVTMARHVGLMWVAMEATTLSIAPAIYFNRNAQSLEATWKYLLMGSVGIALALFGSYFLAYSGVAAGLESTLLFDELMRDTPQLSGQWLHVAFVLLFVGYGTKLGLAPLHWWKPDAYGEAPGIVGSLLAGGVTSCAFLALVRAFMICRAGTDGQFAQSVMVTMGLVSMAVAALFLIRERDFKRMLAYSSVEHMGILVLGIGLGGAAVYGALLHLLNNGLTKVMLFLSAGNIHRAYGSKVAGPVQGALRRVPISGALFLVGFLAICGSPPFGPFISEWTIFQASLGAGQFLIGGLYLLFLAITFVGMGTTVLPVVQGDPPEASAAGAYRENAATVAPIMLAVALVLLLGVWIPQPLAELLRSAAAYVDVPR